MLHIRASPMPRWRAGARRSKRCWREHDCDHLVFCGANRFGSAVQWLTHGRSPPRRSACSRRASATRCSCNTSTTRRRRAARRPGRRRLGRRVLDQGGARGAGQARRSRTAASPIIGPLSAEQHAVLSARVSAHRQSQPRLHHAAAGEVGRRARLAARRRAFFRSRHGGAARRRSTPGLNERELGNADRARLCRAGRHNRHPLHRRDVDGARPISRVPRQFPTTRNVQSGRRRGGRNHRRVLGSSGPGAALVRARRADASFIAICTRRPTPPSTPSPRCSRPARRRRK